MGMDTGAQLDPAQQSPPPAQSSPSAPHAAGWQMPGPSPVPEQEPEQQSELDAQRSHCSLQPPAGAQRRTPPADISQSREQQSPSPPHVSPTCRAHGLWSLAMHIGSAAQWPTECMSSTHWAEQQSSLDTQISPCTRQPSSSAHLPAVHVCPQHSPLPPHVSPAGLHGGEGGAHLPPMQRSAQQSAPVWHGPPAGWHLGAWAQTRPAPSAPWFTHASEQHCPATLHCAEVPSHPTPPPASA
jgi:hypothetical protein